MQADFSRRWLRGTWMLAVALLTACASQPERAAGPVLETPVLQGEIRDGVYHARGDWFQVMLPAKPDTDDYRRLQVHEEYPAYVAFAAFTPGTDPGEYYRVYAEDLFARGQTGKDLKALADSAVNLFGKQLADQRLEPLQLVQEESWSTAHTQGLMRFYTETTPMSSLSADTQALGEDYTAYIMVYTTQRDGRVFVLWAEWPHDCKLCAPPPAAGTALVGNDPIVRALAENQRAADFLDSLQIGAVVQAGKAN